ncbi:hypothetical protein PM082_007182 [Marasmius tenuissimus]|nr:hypothetical protein PM082_007182 [Marasmius tenuissimus]
MLFHLAGKSWLIARCPLFPEPPIIIPLSLVEYGRLDKDNRAFVHQQHLFIADENGLIQDVQRLLRFSFDHNGYQDFAFHCEMLSRWNGEPLPVKSIVGDDERTDKAHDIFVGTHWWAALRIFEDMTRIHLSVQ